MDVLTEEQRHKVMANIHSKDTSIEIKLRKALWHEGFRYRKNYAVLPGKPDIAITKYKIAIFCDSEFFHGKDWCTILLPRLHKAARAEYWKEKIIRNMKRDHEVNESLNYLGWTVVRFWGKEITRNVDGCVAVIKECVFQQMLQRADDMDEPFHVDEDSQAFEFEG